MHTIDSVIAANRFGLGARPGDLEYIGSDARSWLSAQIASVTIPPPAPVQALTPATAILADFQQALIPRQRTANSSRRTSANTSAPIDAEQRAARQRLGVHYLEQVAARVASAVTSEQPFRERLVHFWSNHFAVSADKPPVVGLAGAFENEAIRPHVCANFVDLLRAAISHPAMLTYLDNQRSIGTNSDVARRLDRRPKQDPQRVGINENLAREILELHTLGVDGGYTQQDVIEFAKALTGWSVGGGPARRASRGRPGEFLFDNRVHEPGRRSVLGKIYPESGREQADAILRDLALHPATARHIAVKIARHFIADDPPAVAIERLATAYTDSRSELREVYRALIAVDASWRKPFAKYKTPDDFVMSMLRAVQYTPTQPRLIVASLTTLGQAPYQPGSPAGWPDVQSAWDGSDALLKRAEFAIAFGRQIGDRFDPVELGQEVLGPNLSDHALTAIAGADSAAQGLALLLASPDFLRR